MRTQLLGHVAADAAFVPDGPLQYDLQRSTN
jgi:hypothetical protein